MGLSIRRPLVLSVLAGVVSLAVGVSALEVPYLAGRVNDQAGLLDDGFEGQLEERLRLLEEETGAQVAVLTIPSLEGDPLEVGAERLPVEPVAADLAEGLVAAARREAHLLVRGHLRDLVQEQWRFQRRSRRGGGGCVVGDPWRAGQSARRN